MNAILYDHVQ